MPHYGARAKRTVPVFVYNPLMLRILDGWLNGITMYRVTLYLLAFLAASAIALGSLRVIAPTGPALAVSLGLLLVSCYLANRVLAVAFRAPSNPESSLITALILFFVLAPSASYFDALLAIFAATVAMASKYFLAFGKQHLINPAAFAAIVVGIPTGAAVWWIGTAPMLPLTLIATLLVARKVRRMDMVGATLGAGVVAATALALVHGSSVIGSISQIFLSWPIVFYAGFMVTEPLTAPGTTKDRLLYGAFAGFFSSLPLHIGAIYSTPELTLAIANLASFWTGLRRRLILKLDRVTEVARDVYELSFLKPAGVRFRAGQYLEWTLDHASRDDRGIRRYFTIASAPEEDRLRIGVKVTDPGSSFKDALKGMEPGDRIGASTRSGSFVLPSDPSEKIAFIAGGIGVTPFRSMVSHLLLTGQERDVVLFYAARAHADVAYADLFAEAGQAFGMRTVYVFSEQEEEGTDIEGAERGFIDEPMLARLLPDHAERTFYLSGPNAMVQAYRKLLTSLGVSPSRIRTDYFPGF